MFLVLGPWHHGQEIGDGSTLGALKFGSDTALEFRQQILAPFLAQYLKDGAPKADIAPVTAYRDGHATMAAAASLACGMPERLLGHADAALPRGRTEAGLHRAASGRRGVRGICLRPGQAGARIARGRSCRFGYSDGITWSKWLVDDQREPRRGRTC